jgi:flagellar biosynthesis/type III secretory pathway M-ring protein FliF/YscJ
VRPTRLNTSDKVSLAAILVVAIVLMVLLILFTASDKMVILMSAGFQ